MMKNQALGLSWIGKETPLKLEPRVLVEEESYNVDVIGQSSICDNSLIFGDNLLALKALEEDYKEQIKCVYIDPPYNTGNAFDHYDDGVEHSIWLSLMKPRLEIIHKLLREDGSLWISIDDEESHYLKVLCDEIFGRKNFVSNVIWEKKYSPQNDAKWLSDSHDHILVYAKNKSIWRPNLLPRTEDMDKRYKNPDNDPRGPWKPSDLSVKTANPKDIYPIETPSGRIVTPPESRSWVVSKEKFQELIEDNRVWFGKTGNNVPSIKKFLTEVQGGAVSKTIWFRSEVGDNQEAKKEVKALNPNDVFATPKPERLIKKIITLATNPNDIILDSFSGSGTTGAVAHKMGRRWIMIELGNHCNTHILPRLKKVIDGKDEGGVTKEVNWQGGGGFRYYKLAPSLLERDKFGNWIISKAYNPSMLAEAMCKHKGFTYQPDEMIYWKQGFSTENDFIFTTTQFITPEVADKIQEEMKPDETLLICCKAFSAKSDHYPNITFSKIPTSILKNCEYGKDDYSLNVNEVIPNNDSMEQLTFFVGDDTNE